MIGGWRPWERWPRWQRWIRGNRWNRWNRWTTARRLALHARREAGAPPPDLLRRLREDVPALPAMAYRPAAAAQDERRGAPPRRWLLAASLAAALTGGVLGLRVWQVRSRLAGEAAPPGAAAASSGVARTAAGTAAGAAGAAGDSAGAPAGASPATPSTAAPRDVVALKREALEEAQPPSMPEPGRAAPREPAPPPPPPRSSVPPHAWAPAPTASPSVSGAAEFPGAAGGAGGVAQPPGGTAGAAGGAPASADGVVASESAPLLDEQPLRAREMDRPGAAAQRAHPPSAKAAAQEEGPAGAPPPVAAPLRSSFGADTGTDSYRSVRRGLLDEGRLPRAASVRADELANAFDLAAQVPAAGRPELTVEGAPLPAAGAVYLLRCEVRGLVGPSSADAVEVDFDPAVVARFRRVGATAHRGGASALYEIELRPAAGHAASARSARVAEGSSPTGPPPPSPPAASRRQLAAASPRSAGDRPAATATPPGDGSADRVIATLRVVPRDRLNVGGNMAGATADYLGRGTPEGGKVLRLSQLRPSWESASPALRAQGLAVQFAQALAAKDPAPRLEELRVQARALAAELPDDPKAAELLDLIERAAALAGAPGPAPPRPP